MPRILKTRRLKVTKNKTRSKKGGARRALDNKSIRKAVEDYIKGGSAKENVIDVYGEIEDWNTSKVTNMRGLFGDEYYFNQDISNWDVSNVTDMTGMFYLCGTFNQPIGKWGKKTRNVNIMNNMFAGAGKFNQDISKWDTSKVTNMEFMFLGAGNFNQDISKWDTSKVTNMEYMFNTATKFNQPIGKWDVSKVTDMSYMFAGAESFNLPINRWDVSNVVNIEHMFHNAVIFNKKLTTWGDKLPTNTDFSLIFGNKIAQNNKLLTKSERKFFDKIAPWFLRSFSYDYSIGIKKFAKRDEEDRECSICMDTIEPKDKKNTMITPCNHAYHKDCLKRWMKDRSSCPDCRRTLPEPK
jgi:surface protein